MKKAFLKFIPPVALCLAVVIWGSPAIAGIASSVHDFQASGDWSSLCEPCHLPHGAQGERLWANTKVGGASGWSATVVGQLCGSCHYGATSLTFSVDAPHDVTNLAYSDSSHGPTHATLTGMFGTDDSTAAGFPYQGEANMQCTSCHDPHDNGPTNGGTGVRPFLRDPSGAAANIGDVCIQCHGGRDFTDYGTLNDTGGYSNHPEDIAYAPAATDDLPGLAALDTALFANSRGTAATSGTNNDVPLGGKLLGADGTTGNMGCPTCHMVHGDSDANGGSPQAPFAWLLVADNDTYSDAANGSALCVACHQGDGSGSIVINGSLKDHPIHDDTIQTNAASGGWPNLDFAPWLNRAPVETTTGATWPKANIDADSYADEATCHSCHSAHYGVATSPMLRTDGDGGDATAWCDSCHANAADAGAGFSGWLPYGHHSNNKGTAISGYWASSQISCEDCHTSGNTNLNYIPDTGLGSNSVPISAHRDFIIIYDEIGPTVYGRGNMCLRCHGGNSYTPVGGGAAFTYGAADASGAWNPTDGTSTFAGPSSHGVDRGQGTHFVNGIIGDNGGEYTSVWLNPWEGGGYSMLGSLSGSEMVLDNRHFEAPTVGASSRLICESCHSIMYNVGTGYATVTGITPSVSSGWENNLLLARYEDDAAGTGGAGSAVGSILCVACHENSSGQTTYGSLIMTTDKPGGAGFGTHPVRDTDGSSVITRADPAQGGESRTSGTVLVTPPTADTFAPDGPGPGADPEGTGVTLSFPAANEMDCDSCHRPHDADTDSSAATQNFILEQATSATDTQSMCTICHVK
ncbi:MAG: hypothetical protein GTO08_11450 [Deltaproteobacteria bacterium]|nr:hypothetical protein [Deltaproteobacteria bacterium]